MKKSKKIAALVLSTLSFIQSMPSLQAMKRGACTVSSYTDQIDKAIDSSDPHSIKSLYENVENENEINILIDRVIGSCNMLIIKALVQAALASGEKFKLKITIKHVIDNNMQAAAKCFIQTALSLGHKQAIEVLTECVPQSGLRNIQTFWVDEQLLASRGRATNLASEHTANADANPEPRKFVAVKPKPEDCAAPSPVQTAEPVPRDAMTMKELIETCAALKSIRDDLRSRRLPRNTAHSEYQRAQQLRSEFESRNGVHCGTGFQIKIPSYTPGQKVRAQCINDLILQIDDICTELRAKRLDTRPANPPYTGKISHRPIIDFERFSKFEPWLFRSENSSCTNGEPPAKSRRIGARSSSSPLRSGVTFPQGPPTFQPESLNNMELKHTGMFDKPSESSSVQSCETLSKFSSTLQLKLLNNMEPKYTGMFNKPSKR